MIIFLYILSVLISLPLLLWAAKKDFGYVTVGGLIPLTLISIIPIVNLGTSLVLAGSHWTISGSFLSKRIL
jgi:hypothetical protein